MSNGDSNDLVVVVFDEVTFAFRGENDCLPLLPVMVHKCLTIAGVTHPKKVKVLHSLHHIKPQLDIQTNPMCNLMKGNVVDLGDFGCNKKGVFQTALDGRCSTCCLHFSAVILSCAIWCWEQGLPRQTFVKADLVLDIPCCMHQKEAPEVWCGAHFTNSTILASIVSARLPLLIGPFWKLHPVHQIWHDDPKSWKCLSLSLSLFLCLCLSLSVCLSASLCVSVSLRQSSIAICIGTFFLLDVPQWKSFHPNQPFTLQWIVMAF